MQKGGTLKTKMIITTTRSVRIIKIEKVKQRYSFFNKKGRNNPLTVGVGARESEDSEF